MVCPVCGKKSQYNQCPDCGFDSSRDYERYPTLAPVGKAPAVSARRKAWNTKKQPDEVLQRKHPWLALIAFIAVIVIGIGIIAGLGNKETWRENILRSDEFLSEEDYSDFFEAVEAYPVFDSEYRREQISSVTFLNTLADAPEDAWDVSESSDGKVLAWVTPNGQLYDLFIGAEGGINAGKSCKALFCGYSNAERISNIGFLHTENVQDMSWMFYYCESLTSLDLSSFDTSNVQDMSDMFFWCRSLTDLDLSGFDTSNVQDMSSMFDGCQSLTSLDLSSFDTGNVRDMGWMFAACCSLSSLNLDSFDTGNVQKMDTMFNYCESLTSLDLSSFDTANVQTMGAMFADCKALTSLDLSSFDTSNVQETSMMFENCPAGSDWQHLLKD